MGPLPVESRRCRQRIAGVDFADRRDCGIFAGEKRGERKRRSGSLQPAGANERE